MLLEEMQARRRKAEWIARDLASSLQKAMRAQPQSDILPVVVETAEVILELAGMRERTIPASDIAIMAGDIASDTAEIVADMMLRHGLSLEDAAARGVEDIDRREAGAQVFFAKLGADAWEKAASELADLARRASAV